MNLPKHISYSALTTYQECGQKYKLTKIDGHKEAHAVWFTGGTAVHTATEIYDQQESLSQDSAYLDEIWNTAWFKTVEEDEAIHGDMNTWRYTGREDMSWWYGEGRWMLENWTKLRNGGWSVYKNFIEKEYEPAIEDATVKMAIDRVMVDTEGSIVLLDIKTGKHAQRHPFQLGTYAWALRKDGIEIDRAGFWEARTGSIALWNLDHLSSERVEEIYNTFDKGRKAGIFLPNLKNCGDCGVIDYCKFVNGKYSEGDK